jgi:hypothetical protein
MSDDPDITVELLAGQDDDDSNVLSDIFEAAVEIAITAGVNAGLNALTRGSVPKPEAGQFPMKQSRPPRVVLVGDYARVSGAYMFYEVSKSVFAMIQAINDGRIDSIAAYFIGDDKVTLDVDGWVIDVNDGTGDGRYVDQRVNIQMRSGLPTETAYADIVSRFPTLWTNNHRGDGTASICVQNIAPKEKFRRQAFPLGPTVERAAVSVAARGVCYDWRDVTQDRADEATWKWSSNPVVWLVHLEWFRWSRNWDFSIAPVLSALTAEADYCDQIVATKTGTEKRYRVAGWYFADTARSVVRQNILDTMDGFYTTDGRGRLVVRAGRYYAPTVTIPSRYIEGYDWNRGNETERAISQLIPSFTSAEFNYNTVECDPWTVAEYGDPENMEVLWSPSLGQTRRLAKRKAARVMPSRSGVIETGPYGINTLGEQYLLPENDLEPSMSAPVEVRNAEFDALAGGFGLTVIKADPNIDAWNPDTEEGSPISDAERPALELLTAPTVDDVAAFYDGANTRLAVLTTGPDREDLTWLLRWRVTGNPSWDESTIQDVEVLTGGQVSLNSDVVTPADSLDVQTANRIGSGSQSPWSATYITNSVVVPPPTDLSVTGGVGSADVEWRYPQTAFHHVQIRRGPTNVFSASTLDPTEYTGANGAIETVTQSLAAGIYYWWVVAYDGSGNDSAPEGPQSATVT